MRVLIVCSGNKGHISNYVQDQVNAIQNHGVEIDFYLIRGKGFLNYIKNLPFLYLKVRAFSPKVIHAHFGLTGFLCSFLFSGKQVTTYHGSDIHQKKNLRFSKFAIKNSKINIFVTEQLKRISESKEGLIIPCGVDLNVFKPIQKQEALKTLKLNPNKKYVLFSSRFDFEIKNYKLAKKVFDRLNLENYELLELLGYKRHEVALLFNASEFAFMTSINEGSPQFIKEAMACNCPIVATNVGDIKNNIDGISGCFVTTLDEEDVLQNAKKAIEFAKTTGKTDARKRLIELGYDNVEIAKKLLNVYEQV